MDFQSTALPTELSRLCSPKKTGHATGMFYSITQNFLAELTGFGLSSRLLARCRAADSLTFVRSVLSNPLEHATGMFYSITQNFLAELTGFEPATSCVTGTCPKPLDDSSVPIQKFYYIFVSNLMVGDVGIEPTTLCL